MGYIKQCISNTFLLIKTIEKPEKAVAFCLTFARKKDKKGRIIDLGISPKAYQVVLLGILDEIYINSIDGLDILVFQN